MTSNVSLDNPAPRLNDSGKYLSKVILDDDGSTVILFPEDLMRALKLRHNEILEWNVTGGKIIIERRNIIDTKNI